jgi:hypothetical protein
MRIGGSGDDSAPPSGSKDEDIGAIAYKQLSRFGLFLNEAEPLKLVAVVARDEGGDGCCVEATRCSLKGSDVRC